MEDFTTNSFLINNSDSIAELQQKANNNDLEAIQKLVVLSFHNKDYKEGIKWLNVGRRLDDIFCITHLAYCYYMGLGVDQNKERAIEFYLKSAINGDSDSQVVVAAYYLDILNDFDNYCFWIDKALKDQNYYAIVYHNSVINNLEEDIRKSNEKLNQLFEEKERLIQLDKYAVIQKKLSVNRKEIFAIIYEKKLQNKVHFWRANKI